MSEISTMQNTPMNMHFKPQEGRRVSANAKKTFNMASIPEERNNEDLQQSLEFHEDKSMSGSITGLTTSQVL
eukprot:CAMPEP_0170542858 /NCGR_PEP_ID=MMETSP0211-20121228/2159_1 /TAXON_ID=311385 /ORGANISM="Pseudokeronopsis sp., Strain OXSARD2" /LENGTH=71 /DNA_ID=CAMNT_0010846065 /DNA_START=1280 /DNA_END=1495 /DNA_ORIENTATION=+